MPRDLSPRKEVPGFGFSGLVVSLFGYLELCPGGGAVGQASPWLRGAADALDGRGRGGHKSHPFLYSAFLLSSHNVRSIRQGWVVWSLILQLPAAKTALRFLKPEV